MKIRTYILKGKYTLHLLLEVLCAYFGVIYKPTYRTLQNIEPRFLSPRWEISPSQKINFPSPTDQR